jgi:multimeric flavodoxin WrbA
MKVLGIVGSPRRGDNTDILLEQEIAGAKSAGAE